MVDINIIKISIGGGGIVGIVVVLGLVFATLNPPHTGPLNVILKGAVNTTGFGTHATNITFTNSSGKNTTALIDPTNHQYSTTLPNYQTYKVTVNWVGQHSSYQKGAIKENSYSLNVQQGSSITQDFTAAAPNSYIKLSGQATTGPTTSPINITFVGPNGWVNTTSITGGQYLITLPNLANYTPIIHFNQSTLLGFQSPIGKCNPGGTILGNSSFNLDENAGISNLTKDFSC